MTTTNTSTNKLVDRLRALADEMDRIADEHCETLDFEGYTGLSEHAAELRAVIRVITHTDQSELLAQIVADADEHLDFMREFLDVPVAGGAL